MLGGIFETSKALKTFTSLLVVSLKRNFSNRFHHINCIEANVGYFWRKVSSFHHHSSSFSPLARQLYQNSIQIFNSFIRALNTCLLKSIFQNPISFFSCVVSSFHPIQCSSYITLPVDWKKFQNLRFFYHPVCLLERIAKKLHQFCCASWRNRCSARKYILKAPALIFILFSNIRSQQIQILRKVKNEIYADWIFGGTAPGLKWPLQIAQSNTIEWKFNWI